MGSTHTATKEDFATNGAISNSIDFMVYIGHGHDAHLGEEDKQSSHKANHLQYSYSTNNVINVNDVCENTSYSQSYKDSFCLYSDEVNFGFRGSDLRWVWLYTCNFLRPNDSVTDTSLKEMMTGAHILMGYATQSTVCNAMDSHFAYQLRAGNPIIDSFFFAGKNGEAYEATSDHTQKVLYITQARNETLYSPQIHYEYDSDDVKILTNTFKGLKIEIGEES